MSGLGPRRPPEEKKKTTASAKQKTAKPVQTASVKPKDRKA